jgi:hypothetical protein
MPATVASAGESREGEEIWLTLNEAESKLPPDPLIIIPPPEVMSPFRIAMLWRLAFALQLLHEFAFVVLGRLLHVSLQ